MRVTILFFFLIPSLLFGQKVYLIGDAGEPKNPDQNLQLLAVQFSGAGEQDVLIFLGDNIYPKGLPAKEDPNRAAMEAKLIPQLEVMKSFPGKAFIIPGNHDWAKGGKDGFKNGINMEEFIRNYFEGEEVFLPLGGCPGPIEVPINDQFTVLLLNTQYFLHPWDKPDEDSDCANKSTIEALDDIKTAVKRNEGKHILIAGHQPVYTYGEHHGNFSFKQQIFPPILSLIHI